LSYFVCLIVYSCLVFVKLGTIFCAFFALGILGIDLFTTVFARRDLGHYILLAFGAQVSAAPSNGFISYAISCPLLVVAIGAVNVNLHFGAELTVVRQPPVISKFIVQLFLQFALFSTRTLALDGFVFCAWSTSLWFLIPLSFVVKGLADEIFFAENAVQDLFRGFRLLFTILTHNVYCVRLDQGH